MVRSRSLVCSRTMEMLNEWRFWTSDRAVAIEHDAARRAQRQRPLVVVLGQLLELGVLHDLQHPEAHRQRREQHRDQDLEDRQPRADATPFFVQCHAYIRPGSLQLRLTPTRLGFAHSICDLQTCLIAAEPRCCPSSGGPPPLDRPGQQLGQLEGDDPDQRRCRPPGRPRRRRASRTRRRSSSSYSPMNTACRTVAPKNTTNRGSGWATMNWVPMMPARNPTTVFASPPMPMTPARQGVLDEPGEGAGQQPGDRARRQRGVDDDDEHQIDGDRAADDEPRQGGLERQRQRRGHDDRRRLSLRALRRQLARRRRRQHDQHFLEAREIHRRPDDDLLVGRRRSSRRARRGR